MEEEEEETRLPGVRQQSYKKRRVPAAVFIVHASPQPLSLSLPLSLYVSLPLSLSLSLFSVCWVPPY